MDNIHKKQPFKGKFLRFGKKNQPLHFAPENSIPSDVFGSYTGTPVQSGNIGDTPDLFPVQDADDL